MKKDNPINAVMIATFLNAFGYFSLMAVMAVLFLSPPFYFSAGQIAILLGLLGFSDGFAVFWTPIIQHLSYRQAMLIALLGSGCSLIGIAIAPQFWCCIFFLISLGTSNSLGSLAVRLWVSSMADEQAQIMGFSSLYRTSNAAGGVAPLLVFALPYQDYGQFVFMASGLLYLCGGLAIFFLFKDDSRPSEQPLSVKELAKSIVTQFEKYKPSLSILLVLFCFTYFFSPYFLLPYYYEQYGKLPKYIGFVIALNPILVVLFQGRFSKIFFHLHQWKNASGIVIALTLASLSLLLMYFAPQQYGIWLFVIFITIAEMLLGSQLDFLLSQSTIPSVRPLVFALSGIVWALSRSTGESGSVMILNTLSVHHWDPALWWLINGLLAMIVAGAVFLLPNIITVAAFVPRAPGGEAAVALGDAHGVAAVEAHDVDCGLVHSATAVAGGTEHNVAAVRTPARMLV